MEIRAGNAAVGPPPPAAPFSIYSMFRFGHIFFSHSSVHDQFVERHDSIEWWFS